MLDGILPIDKPCGFTSFDVVAKLRGITKTRKIGHAGTLDPMASGVLPVFFGRATKAAGLLTNHDKAYIAGIRLGITTDTQDITGKILSSHELDITSKMFEDALNGFVGDQKQIPPMYSAVRVNGRRLYDIARSGGEIERKPRNVTVYSAKLLSFDESAGIASVAVKCSKGTYIRALCHDLGQKLGCGAALSSLRRTEACGFVLDDCFTLDQVRILSDENSLEARLLPVSSVFEGFPALTLDSAKTKYFLNGLELGLSQFGNELTSGESLRVYGENGRFLGLAKADGESGKLKIIKLFALEENR